MKSYWGALLALATALAFAVAPAHAYDDDQNGGDAPSAVASLTGETLLTSELPVNPGSLVVEGTCNSTGTSTFTFTATGPATGPYPGTFTETGTVVVQDPATSINAVSFESTFEIDSPLGTVTGTKRLGGFASTSLGLCGAFAPGGGPGAFRFEGTVEYTASIVTPLGSATDSGESFVNIGDTQIRGVPNFNGFIFSETYTSTSLVPDVPACLDDEDGDHQGTNAGGADDDCDSQGADGD